MVIVNWIVWSQFCLQFWIFDLFFELVYCDVMIGGVVFWCLFEGLLEKCICLFIDDLVIYCVDFYCKFWICFKKCVFFCVYCNVMVWDDLVWVVLEYSEMFGYFCDFRNDLYGVCGVVNDFDFFVIQCD